MTDALVRRGPSVHEARDLAKGVGLPEQLADLTVFQVLLRAPAVAERIGQLLLTLIYPRPISTIACGSWPSCESVG